MELRPAEQAPSKGIQTEVADKLIHIQAAALTARAELRRHPPTPIAASTPLWNRGTQHTPAII